jgi:PadR family transcriptional regulator, regulatory protein PadR
MGQDRGGERPGGRGGERGGDRLPGELVPGTLDMLILRTLALGENHGFGIAQHIERTSGEVLRVEEGSLYPALRRLELAGELSAHWGVSENNRRARFYRLTAHGRRRLEAEQRRWSLLTAAIARVMETA